MKKLDLKRKWVKVEIPTREVVNVNRTRSKGQKLECRRSKPRPSKVAKKHESMATTGGQSLNLSKNSFPNAKEILDILSNLFSKCQPHCEVCGNHIIQLTQHLLTKHANCVSKNPVSVLVAHPSTSATVTTTKVQNTEAKFISNANLTTYEHQDEELIGLSDCDLEIKIEHENDGMNDSCSECETTAENIIVNPQPDVCNLSKNEDSVLTLAIEVPVNVKKKREIETEAEGKLNLSKSPDCLVTNKGDLIWNKTAELSEVVPNYSDEYLNIIDPNTEHTLDVIELTLLAETASATTEPRSKIDRINANSSGNPILHHEPDNIEHERDRDPDYLSFSSSNSLALESKDQTKEAIYKTNQEENELVDLGKDGSKDLDSENSDYSIDEEDHDQDHYYAQAKTKTAKRTNSDKGHFQCIHCLKVFAHARTLYTHARKKHFSENAEKPFRPKYIVVVQTTTPASDPDPSTLSLDCLSSSNPLAVLPKNQTEKGVDKTNQENNKLTDLGQDGSQDSDSGNSDYGNYEEGLDHYYAQGIAKTAKKTNSDSGHFQRKHCQKVYAHARTFYKHTRREHPNDVTLNQEDDQEVVSGQGREAKDNTEEADLNPESNIGADRDRHSEGRESTTTKVYKNKNKGNFNCRHCPKTYAHERTLHTHVRRLHNNQKQFVCYCSKRFYTDHGVQKHLNKVFAKSNVASSCHICKEAFATINELTHHIKICHMEVEGGGEERLTLTSSHHVCKICHQVFGQNFELINHIQERHTNEKYECDICRKCFKFKSNYYRHKAIHIGPRRQVPEIEDSEVFTCEKCGKVFSNKSKFRNHLRNHGSGVSFICEKCGKSFKLKKTLDEHMDTHKKEKNFRCELCGRCFVSAKYLRSHNKVVHQSNKYRCMKCLIGFDTEDLLAEHWRDHEGRKPHECPECQKCFYKRKQLTVHMKFHTEMRPHECEHCHKTFKVKRGLDTHLKIHSGIKSFKCGDCHKSFKLPHELRVHHRRMHVNLNRTNLSPTLGF